MYIRVVFQSVTLHQLKATKGKIEHQFFINTKWNSNVYFSKKTEYSIIKYFVLTSACGNGCSGRYTLACLPDDNLENVIHIRMEKLKT